MAATTPAAFDPKPKHIGTTFTAISGSTAILAGQLLSFAATGVDWTVVPCDTDVSAQCGPVGVAGNSAASAGLDVLVYSVGSIVLVCEGAGAALDAGDWVQPSAAAGCVDVMDPAIGSHSATVTAARFGLMLTDASANSTGYCLILMGPMPTASS